MWNRRKVPPFGTYNEPENHMQLITRFELASYSNTELRGLYRKMFNDLAQSMPHSPQRRNALASLDNIRNELASRDGP